MGRHSQSTASDAALAGVTLMLRQFAAHLGPWAAVASMVLLLSFTAAAAPLALQKLTVAEVAHQLDGLAPGGRSVVGIAEGRPHLIPSNDPAGEMRRALEKVALQSPHPLNEALGPPEFVGTADPLPAEEPAADDPGFNTNIALAVSPDLEPHILVVDGSPPAPFASTADGIEVLMSAAAADAIGWQVGERWRVGVDASAFDATLVGTFTARDAGDEFWALTPDAVQPVTGTSLMRQVATRFVTVTAFIAPESLRALVAGRALEFTTSASFPVLDLDLSRDGYRQLATELERLAGREHDMQYRHSDDVAWKFVFSSGSPAAIEAALDRVSTSDAVITLVAAGPVGVGAATLWLLASLVVRRRRESLALLNARGAGLWPLRVLLAAEFLVLGLPAAVLGLVAACLALGSVSVEAVLCSLVVLAAVPVMFAASITTRSLRADRNDLVSRDPGRPRLIAEGLLLGVTALSLGWLIQRGLTTNVLATGVDPVVAAAPVLLAVSVGVVVLRLYPLPLLAIAPAVRRGRRFPTYFGVMRAIREPSLNAVAIFALVLGVSVAVFSVLMVTTLRDGIRHAASTTVGADLRLESASISDDQLQQLEELPGLTAVAALYEFAGGGPSEVTPDFTVVMTDVRALSTVQQDLPGAPALVGSPDRFRGGAIPAVYSEDLAEALDGDSLTVGGVQLEPAATASTMPGLASATAWVLLDIQFADELDRQGTRPRVVLAKVDERANIATVTDAALAILGEASTARTPHSVEERSAGSPVAVGLTFALAASAVLVTLLSASAFVPTTVITAASRRRMLWLLRLLGLDARQGRRVVAWELALPAVLWTLVGGALGAVLPFVVLGGVDLRSYTGGTSQPAVSADPMLVAAVAGGLLVVMAVAAASAMRGTRREQLVSSLRE